MKQNGKKEGGHEKSRALIDIFHRHHESSMLG